MKRRIAILITAAALLTAGAGTALAQAPAEPAPAPAAAEAWRMIEDAGTKLVRLAEAIPPDKYAWRPGEGVRSVSEVFLHVVGGNYLISQRLGAQPPAGFTLQGFDKSTTDKAKVIEELKKSFEHVKAAVSTADPEKTFQGRNRTVTFREIMFSIAIHGHEHLGQAIAYTRSVGITPPWTEEAQQRQQQPPKKNP